MLNMGMLPWVCGAQEDVGSIEAHRCVLLAPPARVRGGGWGVRAAAAMRA